MGRPLKYTAEILAEAARNSDSYAGVLRYLGLQQTGGGQAHISRRMKYFGIDTSHFKGQGWLKGQTLPPRYPPEHYLVLYPNGAPRLTGNRLRKALLAIGRTYECAGCANEGIWQGKPITLHVDHINGVNVDCRPENLRFLCPNCHAQTPTHAGRNKRLRRDRR